MGTAIEVLERISLSEKFSYSGFLVICSISLGRTESGYVFAFPKDPEKIMAFKWSDNCGRISYTTTTCLLMSDGGFDSFGFEAEER